MKQCKATEQFKIEFLGFKLDCTNPGWKTIVVIGVILIFFIGVMFMFRHGLIAFMGIEGGRNLYKVVQGRLSSLDKL